MSDDRRHHPGRSGTREAHGQRLSERDRILRIQQSQQQDRAASGNNVYGQPGPVPYMPDAEAEFVGENRVGGTTRGNSRGGGGLSGELTGEYGIAPDPSSTAEGIGDERYDPSLNDPQRQRPAVNPHEGGGYDEQGLTAGDIRRLRG
jgi:hypothetical protein